MDGDMFTEPRPILDLYLGIQSESNGLRIPLNSQVLYPGFCWHFLPGSEQFQDYKFEIYTCQENAFIVPICPPGTFLGADMLCVQCGPGKYQTGEGMVFEYNCTQCIAGTYSNIQASSAAELCLAFSDLILNSSHHEERFSNYYNAVGYQDHVQSSGSSLGYKPKRSNSNPLLIGGMAGVFTDPR